MSEPSPSRVIRAIVIGAFILFFAYAAAAFAHDEQHWLVNILGWGAAMTGAALAAFAGAKARRAISDRDWAGFTVILAGLIAAGGTLSFVALQWLPVVGGLDGPWLLPLATAGGSLFGASFNE